MALEICFEKEGFLLFLEKLFSAISSTVHVSILKGNLQQNLYVFFLG